MSDAFMVDPEEISRRHTLEVTDIYGNRVVIMDEKQLKQNEVIRIETARWPSGVYFLKLYDRSHMVVRKIIVN
jgi:hypothetical protein